MSQISPDDPRRIGMLLADVTTALNALAQWDDPREMRRFSLDTRKAVRSLVKRLRSLADYIRDMQRAGSRYP